MRTQGQLTMFIVLAIVIATVMAVVYREWMRSDRSVPMVTVSASIDQAVALVKWCAEQSVDDSLERFAHEGDPYVPDQVSIEEGGVYTSIAVYESDGVVTMPLMEELSKDLGEEVGISLAACLKDHEEEIPQFSWQEPKVSIGMELDRVDAQVTIPISVGSIQEQSRRSGFAVSRTIPFMRMYEHVIMISEQFAKEPGWVDVNTLMNSPYEVEIQPMTAEVFLLKLQTDEQYLNGQPFWMRFGVQTKGGSEE